MKSLLIAGLITGLFFGGVGTYEKPHIDTATRANITLGVEEKPEPESKKAPAPKEQTTWKDNPNNCNLETQWVRADNLECLNKGATTANSAISTTQTAYQPSGSWVERCHRWAEMAGITLPPAAVTLIGKESSCNPTIWNLAGSGAGGIPQALPASKMGCGMTWSDADAVCQLKWMKHYVMQRYGSWEAALSFHYANNWY